MRLSRAQATAIAVLVGLAALVAYLVTRNPQPPFLPGDAEHASFEGAERCMVCHDRGGALPQSSNHPVGRDCLRCHGRERS